jgi:hypothetical protein
MLRAASLRWIGAAVIATFVVSFALSWATVQGAPAEGASCALAVTALRRSSQRTVAARSSTRDAVRSKREAVAAAAPRAAASRANPTLKLKPRPKRPRVGRAEKRVPDADLFARALAP